MKDMKNFFNKFSKGDKDLPQDWPADAEQTEHTVEELKKVFNEMGRKIASAHYSIGVSDIDKKQKKIPYYGVSCLLRESGDKMQPCNHLIGDVLHGSADTMQLLAEHTNAYETDLESVLIQELRRIAEEDCTGIIRQRKQLGKACTDLKTARDRLRAYEEQEKDKGGGGEGDQLQNKITQAASQVYEAEREVLQSKDATLKDYYTFEARDGAYAEYVLRYLELQADYFRKCLQVLDRDIPHVKSVIDAKRRHLVYEKDLGEHLRQTGREISYPVEVCITALNKKRALEEQGLFRIAGSKNKIDLLISALDVMKVDDALLDECDPAVVADALKNYFRSLPDPLLTNKLFGDFIAATKKPSKEEIVIAVEECCRRLPPENWANLRYLIKFLAKVNRYESLNKMTTHNLSIVFGPNLLKAPPCSIPAATTAAAAQNVMLDMMSTTPANVVVEVLIDNADQFFPEEMFTKYTNESKKSQNNVQPPVQTSNNPHLTSTDGPSLASKHLQRMTNITRSASSASAGSPGTVYENHGIPTSTTNASLNSSSSGGSQLQRRNTRKAPAPAPPSASPPSVPPPSLPPPSVPPPSLPPPSVPPPSLPQPTHPPPAKPPPITTISPSLSRIRFGPHSSLNEDAECMSLSSAGNSADNLVDVVDGEVHIKNKIVNSPGRPSTLPPGAFNLASIHPSSGRSPGAGPPPPAKWCVADVPTDTPGAPLAHPEALSPAWSSSKASSSTSLGSPSTLVGSLTPPGRPPPSRPPPPLPKPEKEKKSKYDSQYV